MYDKWINTSEKTWSLNRRASGGTMGQVTLQKPDKESGHFTDREWVRVNQVNRDVPGLKMNSGQCSGCPDYGI